MRHRVLSLDVLRCVAVLLVIGRHVPSLSKSNNPLLFAWNQGGWIGVDLFFVLSGFLVSGLLFREHAANGGVRIGRFLVRRGLKIYPAFYVFLGATIAASLAFHLPLSINKRRFLGELLFLQNYLGYIWGHTWTLAVEEHFYIAAALMVALLPIRSVPWICTGILITCLAGRLRASELSWVSRTFPTHLRADSLAFGVLLSYLHHLHHAGFSATIRPLRFVLPVAGAAMLVPPFIFPIERTAWISTYGLTLNYLGAGAILAGLLISGVPQLKPLTFLGALGVQSYSIYLWHEAAIFWIEPPLFRAMGWSQTSPLVDVVAACVLSIAVGFVTARVIEIPVLKLRDRLFPARNE